MMADIILCDIHCVHYENHPKPLGQFSQFFWYMPNTDKNPICFMLFKIFFKQFDIFL
jgi:hypothetical protein